MFDNEATTIPICDIELYTISFFNLFCLSAKNEPTKIETNPQTNKIVVISLNNVTIDSHLINK